MDEWVCKISLLESVSYSLNPVVHMGDEKVGKLCV